MNQNSKINEAKKYFMTLLDMLNAKFTAELKKDSE